MEDSDCSVPLPLEASNWSSRKQSLWNLTQGQFNPSAAGSDKCVPGRVSIVTPTTEARRRFHELFYACFRQQQWPNKELVVVETYVTSPSDFLASRAELDPNVTYVKFPRPEGADWSIGLKRNIGTHLATGEFIANFDDDDLYAPRYLTTLVEDLRVQKALGVTLSSWYIFDTETSTFGYCNPVQWGERNQYHRTHHRIRSMTYGYGFSYVYRREAALQHPYPDQGIGEDYKFFSELQREHGDKCIGLLEDKSGLCLHTLHGGNTSSSEALWEVDREEMRDLDVWECEGLAKYLFQFRRKQEKQNKHIMDWSGKGKHLRRDPQRHYREVLAHTSFGNFRITCRKGATKKEFLEVAEEKLGALPLGTVVFRTTADAMAPIEDNERIGSYTIELWLAFPDERKHSTTTSDSSSSGSRSSRAVHVTIPAACARPPSVCRIFHVDLPLEASVADLRAQLTPLGLPEGAEVFGFAPEGSRRALGDAESVPAKVMLSTFSGIVKTEMVLTWEQAREWQVQYRAILETPEMQKQLDELEAKARGDVQKYSRMLTNLMVAKVFPISLRQFGLPDDDRGPILLIQAVAPHIQYLEGMVATYEIEVLRRDWPAVEAYWKKPELEWVREHLGAPPQGCGKAVPTRLRTLEAPPRACSGAGPGRPLASEAPPRGCSGAGPGRPLASEAPPRGCSVIGAGPDRPLASEATATTPLAASGTGAAACTDAVARPEAATPSATVATTAPVAACPAAAAGLVAAAAPTATATPAATPTVATIAPVTTPAATNRTVAWAFAGAPADAAPPAAIPDAAVAKAGFIAAATTPAESPMQRWAKEFAQRAAAAAQEPAVCPPTEKAEELATAEKAPSAEPAALSGVALAAGSPEEAAVKRWAEAWARRAAAVATGPAGPPPRAAKEERTAKAAQALPSATAAALPAVPAAATPEPAVAAPAPEDGGAKASSASSGSVESARQLWIVVGGIAKGGIVVREGAEPGSPMLPRLRPGSVIVGLERNCDRMRYTRLSGGGPQEGWVSIKLSEGQALLKPAKAWEVLGSRQQGGISVRAGLDLASEELARLRTGALICELEVHAKRRMRYIKIRGDGPVCGWVNLQLPSGQDLVGDAKLWLAVGGESGNGFVVRSGKDLRSDAEEELLRPGSVVLQREIVDGRLHYVLLSGEGPPGGWINLAVLKRKGALVPL